MILIEGRPTVILEVKRFKRFSGSTYMLRDHFFWIRQNGLMTSVEQCTIVALSGGLLHFTPAGGGVCTSCECSLDCCKCVLSSTTPHSIRIKPASKTVHAAEIRAIVV